MKQLVWNDFLTSGLWLHFLMVSRVRCRSGEDMWEFFVTTLCTTQALDVLQNILLLQQEAETLISIGKTNTLRSILKSSSARLFYLINFMLESIADFQHLALHYAGRFSEVISICCVSTPGIQVRMVRFWHPGIQGLPKTAQADLNRTETQLVGDCRRPGSRGFLAVLVRNTTLGLKTIDWQQPSWSFIKEQFPKEHV